MRIDWESRDSRGSVVACLTIGVFAQTGWKPAVFRDGMPPVIAFQAVGGGEVFVEATVTDAGRVGSLTTLRATPPFTQDVLDAVRTWRFQPAEQALPNPAGDPRSIVTGTVESKVMIACVFRPPTLNTPTLGVPPTDIQPGTDDVRPVDHGDAALPAPGPFERHRDRRSDRRHQRPRSSARPRCGQGPVLTKPLSPPHGSGHSVPLGLMVAWKRRSRISSSLSGSPSRERGRRRRSAIELSHELCLTPRRTKRKLRGLPGHSSPRMRFVQPPGTKGEPS